MSVVEVIVAFVVIALVALASATFYNQQRTLLTNFTPNGECKAVLEGQMGYFRQQGMAATGLPWKHDPAAVGGGVSHATAEPSRYNDAWLTSNKRFLPLQNIALVEATTNTNEALVRNYPLQRGAMGILNALYNYQPGICNPAGVDPSTLGVSDALTPKVDLQSMKGFRSSMQIQQFHLTTKGNYPCLTSGTEAWIRPRGFQENVTPKPYLFPPNVHRERGYRVTLNGTYTDRTNTVKSCSLTEEFNFPVDNEAQSVSVIWSTTIPGSEGGTISPPEAMGMSRPACSHTPGKPAGFTLKIGFNSSGSNPPPIETGTVFMCRDMSEQLNPNYCEEGPNHPQRGIGAVMQGNNYTSSDPRYNKWVPCSQVTACGIAPTQFKAHEIKPSIPGSTIYELTYENSTAESIDGFWGCNIRMDVASVDLAGNFKILSTQPGGLANIDAKRFFQPADCYKCFKKKKRSLGAIIVSTILMGPILTCATGVGGACRSSKGLKYVKHSCTNSAPGANKCIKVPVKRPNWTPDTSPMCDPMSVPLPSAYAGTANNMLNIPKSPEGTIYDEPQFFDAQSAFCDVQAICENNRWTGMPYEDGSTAPFVECGKLMTRFKIDISGIAPGQSAPQGTPECLQAVPDTAYLSGVDYSSLYSGLKVCAPGTTGESRNVLCSTSVNAAGGLDVEYPKHALTGDHPNKDPNQYYHFKYVTPRPQNLPSCSEE